MDFDHVLVERRAVIDHEGVWQVVLARCRRCGEEWITQYPVEAPLDLREKNVAGAMTDTGDVTRRSADALASIANRQTA